MQTFNAPGADRLAGLREHMTEMREEMVQKTQREEEEEIGIPVPEAPVEHWPAGRGARIFAVRHRREAMTPHTS